MTNKFFITNCFDRPCERLIAVEREGSLYYLHPDMQAEWKEALVEGGEFPHLPVDYGYRDSLHFWFTKGRDPYPVDIPKGHGVTTDTVLFQANRIDPAVTWEPAACAELAGVPRVFLKTVLTGCVDAAKAQGVAVITPAFLHEIRAKRKEGKGPSLLEKIGRFFGVK